MHISHNNKLYPTWRCTIGIKLIYGLVHSRILLNKGHIHSSKYHEEASTNPRGRGIQSKYYRESLLLGGGTANYPGAEGHGTPPPILDSYDVQ